MHRTEPQTAQQVIAMIRERVGSNPVNVDADIPANFLDDPNVLAAAIAYSHIARAQLRERIGDNKALMLSVFEVCHFLGGNLQISDILQVLSPRLLAEKDIAIAALARDNRHLKGWFAGFCSDADVIEACMRERKYFHGRCYRYFDTSFRSNRDIALRMSEGTDFPYDETPENIRVDRDIARNAVVGDPRNLKHLPSELRNDPKFIDELVALNRNILSEISAAEASRAGTVVIESTPHRGRTIRYTIVLTEGPLSRTSMSRSVDSAHVLEGDERLHTLGRFPVLTYSEAGPLGSYILADYLNGLTLVGQFVFFVKACVRVNHNVPRAPHAVYLLCRGQRMRIYFGRANNLPVGIQIFESESSYSRAIGVLTQRAWGRCEFERVDATTLRTRPVDVEEVAGAARVFVDGFGWRFLIPHEDGALAALGNLRSSTSEDDWHWLKTHCDSLNDFQKKLLISHFQATDWIDEVRSLCA